MVLFQTKDRKFLPWTDQVEALSLLYGTTLMKRNIYMAKILYQGTHGTDDPTRASMPFHMALGAV